MAESVVFTRCCELLARATGVDLGAVRGVVRIALREAGLQSGGLSVPQMQVILRRVLPAELGACGVTDPEAVCAALEREVVQIEDDPGEDAVADAAAVFERFAPR